ncbi:hypothetical protein [Brunnivagina elsteri]|uniref:Uncharacterized protein n=1 Tax=Brunnivagina elsteri CCALA 953 TaxID=987040 RepID=A0A2A2TJJ3_9CYAN|nr:hypothetical protein [Calothrix elsteri]PAX54904.1 hypothetical protein CK510_11730 [Calothrix elsteri CCALA 953]
MISYLKQYTVIWGFLLLASATISTHTANASVVKTPKSQNFKLEKLVQIQPQTTKVAKTKIHPSFLPILPKLKSISKFPILLPRIIPGSEGENKLYAVIETATANKYGIILGFTSDCGGGNACRFGDISAKTVTKTTPRLLGKTVKLANGITAYFIDAKCGANCSDSTLTWQFKGVRYTAGIKAGKLRDLLQMANSFIAP